MQLATGKKLPERERTAIETTFYRVTEDPWKMVEMAKRNITYHPAEPRYYTVLGQAQMSAGDAVAAVETLRTAVRLAPEDWMPVLALEDALVEAGQFPLALDEFNAAMSRGVSNHWIYNGAGAALMGLERYDEAFRAFEMNRWMPRMRPIGLAPRSCRGNSRSRSLRWRSSEPALAILSNGIRRTSSCVP